MSDEDLEMPSSELRGVETDSENDLLPVKSKRVYLKEYDKFMAWCRERNFQELTENVVVEFFQSFNNGYKSSTLWRIYSILKAMINIRHNTDISRFPKLHNFLKHASEGYEPKKSKILTYHQIETFINGAPDVDYLAIKVVLIMGYSGACRRYELMKMQIDDVEFKQDLVFVTVANSKTSHQRLFIVRNELWVNLIKKYVSMRPGHVQHSRLFIYYRGGRCTVQPIGINKMGVMPKIIARFLQLQNPDEYSGHCFRRSSESHLEKSDGDLITIKQHGFTMPKRKSSLGRDTDAAKRSRVARRNEDGTKKESRLFQDRERSVLHRQIETLQQRNVRLSLQRKRTRVLRTLRPQPVQQEQSYTENLANPPVNIKQEYLEIEENPVVIKEEFPLIDDPLDINSSIPQDHLSIFTEDLVHVKQESEDICVKQEIEHNYSAPEVFETRIPQPLSSRTSIENKRNHQEMYSREDLDSVDQMFLGFAKRFKRFSSKRQLAIKTKFCQILTQAEMEEIDEMQGHS